MGMYPGGNIVRVTPTVIAGTTDQHDIMFDATEIPNAVASRGGISRLMAVYFIDVDNENHDMDLIFMDNQTNLGTVDAAASISDSDIKAANIIGGLKVDYSDNSIDLNSNQSLAGFYGGNAAGDDIGYPTGPLMLLKAAEGSTSVYFTGIAREAIAFASTSDLVVMFHLEYIS